MKKRILLFAACAAVAPAVAAPLASAGFDVTTSASALDFGMPALALALSLVGLAAWLSAPAAKFVARHVKQALEMSLKPGGRSPAVALIASKARHLARIARDRISITSTWRMCPST